jgi:hypothetical protein
VSGVCLWTLGALVLFASTAAADTIRVPASGSLQKAINAARGGDVILLEPNVTYSGNFKLPPHAGDGFVTIRTAGDSEALPVPGVRITPAAPQLAKITSPNTISPIVVAQGASHWRLELLEIHGKGGTDVVRIGLATESVASAQPHHIVLDRVYVHGDPVAGQRNGVVAHASHFELRDSYVSDIKLTTKETHAFIAYNGAGPYLLENNYLEASGVNVMIGGGDPVNATLVPSDIVVRRNHIAKNVEWMKRRADGTFWNVKNLFELKLGRNVTIEGNVMEHNWSGAGDQPGYAVLMRTENQYGNCDWCETGNVLFQNNIVRKTPGAISLTGLDFPSGGTERGVRMHDVTFRNNLFTDIDVSLWKVSAGNSSAKFAVISGVERLTFDHNTIATGSQTSVLWFTGAVDSTDFVFSNNLSEHENYGVKGDGIATGTPTLQAYTVNSVFVANVLAGGKASTYPIGNFFPAASTWPALFADFAGGDFRLAETSPYRGGASDGKDIGVDFDEFETAFTAAGAPSDGVEDGAEAQEPPPPPPNAVPSVTVAGPGAAVFVGAPATLTAHATDSDGTIARVDFYVNGERIGSTFAAPFVLDWVVPRGGTHAVTAVAVDDRGASATSAAVQVATNTEIVLYASQASAIVGDYALMADPTAAGGVRLSNPNRGAAKNYSAAAAPANYVEFTFVAEAGRSYQLWIRGKAEKNSYANDSVFVQFSGISSHKIGTTASLSITLEDDVNAGLSGWGWQDDGFGGLGAPVVFDSTGPQTIRIQPREDGLSIDQIVISPERYLTTAPGAVKNDATIVPQ